MGTADGRSVQVQSLHVANFELSLSFSGRLLSGVEKNSQLPSRV